MTTIDTATIVVLGKDGKSVTTAPIDGTPATPLPGGGNGDPGKTNKSGDECTLTAQPGTPGNSGGGAPRAPAGGNAANAPSLTFSVTDVVADVGLSVFVTGGEGGRGGDGGTGGAGGKGGNAGAQPEACAKEYGPVPGGRGGVPGDGGDAGPGGPGGSGAITSLLYDKALTTLQPDVTSSTGAGGEPGEPGKAGKTGQGGVGSDGTHAADGGGGSPGNIAERGASGAPGQGTVTPVSEPELAVVLLVTPLPAS